MVESADEEDWVVVKKQRIVILVPPPSPVKESGVHDNNCTKIKAIRSVGRSSVISKNEKLLAGANSRDTNKHADNAVQMEGELEKLNPDHAEHEDEDYAGRINCGELGTPRGSKLSEGTRHKLAVTLPQREIQITGKPEKHALNLAEDYEGAGRLKHGRTDTSKGSRKLSERIIHKHNVAFSNKDEISTRDHASVLQCQQPAANPVPPLENGIKHDGRGPALRESSLQHAPQTCILPEEALVARIKRKRISCPETFNVVSKLPISTSNAAIRKMRTVNLRRRLQMLGGLHHWLSSQHLAQFIKIFQREKLGIHQLVNLTMSRLKEMGADPVGPRRKLINAIDSLCQPCYLEGS